MPKTDPPPATRIVLRVQPLADLWRLEKGGQLALFREAPAQRLHPDGRGQAPLFGAGAQPAAGGRLVNVRGYTRHVPGVGAVHVGPTVRHIAGAAGIAVTIGQQHIVHGEIHSVGRGGLEWHYIPGAKRWAGERPPADVIQALREQGHGEHFGLVPMAKALLVLAKAEAQQVPVDAGVPWGGRNAAVFELDGFTVRFWKAAGGRLGVISIEGDRLPLPFHMLCRAHDDPRRVARPAVKKLAVGETPEEGMFRPYGDQVRVRFPGTSTA